MRPPRWLAIIQRCRSGVSSSTTAPSFSRALSTCSHAKGWTSSGLQSDSAGAIRLVTELRPDVTLVDIDLGDEDGFELAQRLHAISGAPKVILVSTHAEEDLAHLIERSPTLGFIAKARLSAQAIRDLLDRAA